ncbi:MAG TPA: tRNA uridine-5-carboxymethylaminomethyl(34) synthesis GTPase MnmE [Thermoanaerobaculia bacterium]|nr:tRNA uridine-5-carboxymethylaminomethyl(34) synthesis GTPase MnmE [Thermoanaerobaculia bacterium]
MSGAAVDTIVAPATPVGRSALAIVRIDGPQSFEVFAVLPEVRRATLVRLGDIDECIAIRYEAPHSFTGNDLVELIVHGSPVIVERVVDAAIALGARIAEPGEFTERAVLNGKLDLVQAESIADLINSRTALQAKLSLANLEGALSTTAARIRESLLHVISRLEAALDFSEEGYDLISGRDARVAIESAIEAAQQLAATYRRGRATTHGLTCAIVGRPNAGKSTLLNLLVGSERAIVTDIPGTTRDIVRETIEIGGLPVTILDTAGLRDTTDVVESIGVERARQAASSADVVLYLVDATTDEKPDWPDALIVYTKTDLAPAPAGSIAISRDDIQPLLDRLDAIVGDSFVASEGSLVNARQQQAVAGCEEALRDALGSLDAGADEQLIVVDLYRASNSLGLLTGAITREEVFAEIFSKFCIGK